MFLSANYERTLDYENVKIVTTYDIPVRLQHWPLYAVPECHGVSDRFSRVTYYVRALISGWCSDGTQVNP